MIAKLTSVALRSTGVLDIGRPLSCAGVYGARFRPLLAASLSAPPCWHWCPAYGTAKPNRTAAGVACASAACVGNCTATSSIFNVHGAAWERWKVTNRPESCPRSQSRASRIGKYFAGSTTRDTPGDARGRIEEGRAAAEP